ncbi:stage V sporulation protein AC [Hydrogenibacillus sp. N12]|uniref:stage V sporulation protein AC n=1 Tax=Hydrogenibacillus sp. N12 TaxID=2866627 RepID=UPI001C7D8FF7|nr:stage V sporulation protein AC [Hydrogenibacillus sp. N12]QZA33347.1 stage V sporulation protein AC [Hydrogenibacillus sp. N12]
MARLPEAKAYQALARSKETTRPVATNVARAFLVGGLISVVGQAFMWLYETVFGFTEQTASNPTVATLVFLSVLLTGLGVYDKIGQWAGAGSIVPVTGFANTMAASALDARSEGLVYGVGANMFKVAGPVIVFGTVAAFVVALVRALVEALV